jgi:putative restriction endonuclease
MPSTQQLWLGKLANLNVARTAARGLAPHKPIMLLSVIDLIERGLILDGWVPFCVELASI